MFKSWKPDDGKLSQPVPPGWRIVDLGLLGKGGMSRVYRVRDEELGREVAFKVLRPELVKEDDALERFVEEAKITAQLDHPNIPPVYALSTEKKKSTCFTMKVLEGLTLQQLLDRDKPKGVEALLPKLEVLIRVCDAVAFAHSKGILHCDLKPTNVMVAEHGQIYLVDWGLAHRKASLTKEEYQGQAIGTPAYMAPEQALGKVAALDERTDIFGVGAILYRVLTGRAPYVAATAEETIELAGKGVVLPPEQAAPQNCPMPRRLVTICARALAARPEERYQTVAELRRDVEDFIHGTARLPERTFKAGEAIVREGEAGDCAYVILDGHCQASRVVAGKTQPLKLLGPGEMFGETAVLTGAARLATVTAMMDTVVAVVDRTFLEEEMERTSLMALAVRAVAGSFLDLNGQTAALLKEQRAGKAVELALRELALKGRTNVDGTRWVTWSELLPRLAEQTSLEEDAVVERLARAPAMQIDRELDRLTLRPLPPPR